MTREEAAAKAIFDIRDDAYDEDEWSEIGSTDRELYECQSRAALAAADAHDAANGVHRLVIDEETVERAARVLAPVSDFVWERLDPLNRLRYINQARAVLAAAVKEDGDE